MGLLDQLLEKKDLRIYLRVRRAQLKAAREEALLLPAKQRGRALYLLTGRTRELDELSKHVHANDFQRFSVHGWAAVKDKE